MRILLAILVTLSIPFTHVASARDAVTLTVSAASDLTFAFDEIGTAFEEETGVHVDFNFGSTGHLTQQIEAGAPVDVFAAANVSYIDQLNESGLIIEDTQASYGRGQIVLWTRSDSGVTVQSIERLANDDIRTIAIANPDHAPYGAAAREALINAGIWDDIQDKLVLGENIGDTMRYAETGNVDVAIVALSLAINTDQPWTIISQDLYTPIDQSLAVIAGTAHEEEARAFASFVGSPRGREIMRSYGFLLPGENGPVASPSASPES